MRVLAIPNAHALAHVSRLLEISKVLRGHGHEVIFAGYGKYLNVVAADGFQVEQLPYISVEQIVKAVRTQRLWELYPQEQLECFVEAELALYERLQPDLVLLDNRPSARTSADAAGIKSVAVLNVHMSNCRRIPFFSLQNRVPVGLPGLTLLDAIENVAERVLYDRLVMGALNRIRRRLGLERLYAYEHETGGATLLADIPEFSPAGPLPEGTLYVGPLIWHNNLPAPKCLAALEPAQPTIYLSLGSEGLADLLVHIAQFARRGIQVVIATGQAQVDPGLEVPQGVFLEQYINAEALLPRCDLVCCHGGNGTIYQALSHGLPLVVVATHQEQHYGGKRLQRLGLGASLTLPKVQREGLGILTNAVQRVLGDERYRDRARHFADLIRPWDAPNRSAQAIERYAVPA